jgi:hypothetical protein
LDWNRTFEKNKRGLKPKRENKKTKKEKKHTKGGGFFKINRYSVFFSAFCAVLRLYFTFTVKYKFSEILRL